MDKLKGTLYVVATPIGNMEDITLRALKVLESVDLILCEDTRTSGILLKRYNIHTPTMSYHAHSTKQSEDKIISLLDEGKNLALISDAGTPGVSDPGNKLVNTLRKKEEITVISIPGPSAVTALISIAGALGNEWTFLGFVPHKKGRETFFKNIRNFGHPVLFYESTHRILKTLDSLKKEYGETVFVVLGRELTKHFEETLSGSPEELLLILKNKPEKQKGEFTVLVELKDKI